MEAPDTRDHPDWGELSWTDLKLAGRVREIDVPAKVSLEGDEAVKNAKTLAIGKIKKWYEAWGKTARAPPDFMTGRQLVAEAKELGLRATVPAKNTARNTLFTRIMVVHAEIRFDDIASNAEGGGAPSGEIPDVSDAILSNPGGLGVAFDSGKCLSKIPQITDESESGLTAGQETPAAILALFGTPVLRYTHSLTAASPARAQGSDELARS